MWTPIYRYLLSFKKKPKTKSRNERLLFTLLETEKWNIKTVVGKQFGESGGLLQARFHALFPTFPTNTTLSVSKEQHSWEQRRKRSPLDSGLEPHCHQLLIAYKPLEWSPGPSQPPGTAEGSEDCLIWSQNTGDPWNLPVRELFSCWAGPGWASSYRDPSLNC